MKYLGYSELTNRVYILPASVKIPKIDITDDVNELIGFKLNALVQWLIDNGYYLTTIGTFFNENDIVDIHYTISELFDKFSKEQNVQASVATEDDGSNEADKQNQTP